MTSPARSTDRASEDEDAVRELYRRLLSSWNERRAVEFAGLFAEDGNIVGFDGSPVDGSPEIEEHLRQIFADHMTARYVGIVREVRFLAPDVAILRAVAGMVPPGQAELNPAANSVQTLVAARRDGVWRIALYQNTPAQFHGRPEAVRALTDELGRLLPRQ